MPDSPKRRRSPISTLLAVVAIAIALIVMAAIKVTSFFRPRYVPIEQLKFPVLVFQPGGTPIFAEWDSIRLEKFEEGSTRTPVDGTVIVDSDFNQFMQEHVERKRDGDLKWLARRYLPWGFRVTYTFDLRRSPTAGIESLRELIAKVPPLSDDLAIDVVRRSEAMKQSTMADVLDVLQFIKPPDPPAPSTEPATMPSDSPSTEPAIEGGEKLPGDPH